MSKTPDKKLPFDEAGLARHIERALAIKKPSKTMMAIAYQVIKKMFRPTLIDSHKLPDKPCLFVSNHSLFAVDAFVFTPVLYKELGRFPRGLADRFMWTAATEKPLLNIGAVLGNPQVCSSMMENGLDLIVFPGGAHEAVKHSKDKYQLLWKERYGFVRLAAQHGYTIMPLAQVGPDDFYSYLVEGEDLMDSNVGKLLQKLGLLSKDTRKDMIPPIPAGLFGSLLPKPQPCYYQFGDPVDLSQLKGQQLSQTQLHSIRNDVSGQIETMLEALLQRRDSEQIQQGLWRRLMNI
jgi:1-acyl-sn-glycerol-3-phosphate acyltransferase